MITTRPLAVLPTCSAVSHDASRRVTVLLMDQERLLIGLRVDRNVEMFESWMLLLQEAVEAKWPLKEEIRIQAACRVASAK